jgi:flavin-dependent dehydrogenase
VEIYPGFAASEVLTDDDGAVIGVATGDMGVERNGEPGPNYTRGMELLRQICSDRRGRARIARQAADLAFKLDEAASRRNTASASKSFGRSSRSITSRAWCSTPSAGRST